MSRQIIIYKLIEELKTLNANDFEKIGNYFLGIYTGREFINAGLNTNGKPVGYTVDSITFDSCLLAEYSTEIDYFSDKNYKKIKKDIDHARAFEGKGSVEKIYLISSQQEPTSFRKIFNQTDLFKENQDILEIIDARILATHIFEQSVLQTSCRDFYSDFLSDFKKACEQYIEFGAVPEICDNYIEDNNIKNSIDKFFEKKDYCILYGLSGSGKTQLAKDYINSRKDNFDNYLWVDGRTITKDSSLKDIKGERIGAKINIVGTFNQYKTLLVIDNIAFCLESSFFDCMAQGFSLGGRVLVTSQLKSHTDNNFSMPKFSPETLLQILGDSSPLAKELIKHIYLPVILATVNNIVKQSYTTYDSVISDIMENPQEVKDADGKSILKKILLKVDDSKYLEQICNTGIYRFDSNLLKKYIGILNFINLDKMALIQNDSISNISQIHDFIFECMKTADKQVDFFKFLSSELDKAEGSMSDSLLRQVHLCYSQLEKYCLTNTDLKNNWLTYALLQVETDDSIIAEKIYEAEPYIDMPLGAMRSLIDAKEAVSFKKGTKTDIKNFLERCIELFDGKKNYKKFLYHHLGKYYRREKEIEKAVCYFKNAIEIDNQFYPSYAQIVKSEREERNKEEGEKAAKYLINKIKEKAIIPLRISLALLSDLRSYRNIHSVFNTDTEVINSFKEILFRASFDQMYQYYEAMASFISIFGYTQQDVCLELFKHNPKQFYISPDSIAIRQWINFCDTLSYFISMINLGTTQYNELKNILLVFTDAMQKQNPPTPYQVRGIAKAYCKAKMYKEAIAFFMSFSDLDDWCLYWKALAELKLDNENCLKTAQKMIELSSKNPKAKDFLSSRYELYCDCLSKFGDKHEAENALEKAIKLCAENDYKKSLTLKLQDLRKIIT